LVALFAQEKGLVFGSGLSTSVWAKHPINNTIFTFNEVLYDIIAQILFGFIFDYYFL
jgi:hypothetical protein